MRWSYKTVHFELKKEGILGSSFLDESEIELSLNEYGKAGWELVSMLETLDGLVAVFKQPLSLDTGSFYPSAERRHSRPEPEPVDREQFELEPEESDEEETDSREDDLLLVEDFDVIEEKSEKRTLKDADVGSIIIE